MSPRPLETRSGCTLRAAIALGTLVLLVIVGTVLVANLGRREAPSATTASISVSSGREIVLGIAHTPEKAAFLTAVIKSYNATRPRVASGKRVRVEAIERSPVQMVQEAGDNAYQAVNPDSSIWLDDIDRAWQAKRGAGTALVGESVHYIVSPVVIAMWQDVAARMGYPGRDIGWRDVLTAASIDTTFKWSHPSPTTASGLLATLAAFYAGSGVTRGLTEEQATAPATLDYVRRLEATVKHYGEGELAVMQQVESLGRDYLDAFVVQEQLVVQYNARHPGALVAVYPVEGTLWQDHPLVLLEHPDRTDDERQAFAGFRDYLLSADVQKQALAAGYRPADLSISLESAESPIRTANGVDPKQPHTTLQVPSPAVIQVVKNVWWYTKRQANIYLIADTSGSMAGTKLSQAQEALRLFVEQVQGPEERVGLISFADSPHERVPLTKMAQGRATLIAEIDRLQAGGNTALLDAVAYALERLTTLNDQERINAIVVMTDGQENASRVSLQRLVDQVSSAYNSDLRVVVFCIAYGRSADMKTLQAISQAGGGFSSMGEPETIRELYETLSSYF